MNAKIFHLPFSDDDEIRKMRLLTTVIDEDEMYLPSPDEIDEFWELAGEETTVESESHPEILKEVWAKWNAGSGRESVDFARRECKDCDAEFTGEQDDGSVDLEARQKAAEDHERQTRAAGDAHTVEHGTRSLSTGDIVVIEGQGYLCRPVGWEEIPEISISDT